MKTAVEKLFNIWLEKEYISPNEWSEAIEMEKNRATELTSDLFDKALNEVINQIKNTHQTISEESKKDLENKLSEYVSKGWLLIGPTHFSYETNCYVHSQLIFKPNKSSKLWATAKKVAEVQPRLKQQEKL